MHGPGGPHGGPHGPPPHGPPPHGPHGPHGEGVLCCCYIC